MNMGYEQLKEKWRFRFQFFDANGAPGLFKKNMAYYSATRSLSFMNRVKISANFLALFFGPIYFFVLGMWRKNLSLIGIGLLLSSTLVIVDAFIQLPDAFFRTIGFLMNAL